MMDEKKIELMTSTALLEKRSGKMIYPAGHEFRGDYIGSHILRSFIMYTVTAVILAGLFILYMFDELLEEIDIDGLVIVGKQMAFLYVAGLAVYLVITWIVYSRRYRTAGKNLKMYQAKLKRLEKYYDSEEKNRGEDEGRYLGR